MCTCRKEEIHYVHTPLNIHKYCRRWSVWPGYLLITVNKQSPSRMFVSEVHHCSRSLCSICTETYMRSTQTEPLCLCYYVYIDMVTGYMFTWRVNVFPFNADCAELSLSLILILSVFPCALVSCVTHPVCQSGTISHWSLGVSPEIHIIALL